MVCMSNMHACSVQNPKVGVAEFRFEIVSLLHITELLSRVGKSSAK
jgi:hypothetical protein